MSHESFPSAESTARSIENVARMQAKKAEDADVYHQMAPLAPEGYSQIGGNSVPMLGDDEVYVKENGKKPGKEPSAVKIKISGKSTGKSAKLSTEGGKVSGEVRDEIGNRKIRDIESIQDMRQVAAAALWAKRKELKRAEDRKQRDTRRDLEDVIGVPMS